MKKVLIVVATVPSNADSMNWLPLRDALRQKVADDVHIDMTSLSSLVFDISNDNAQVLDARTQRDVASYDLVVIRNVGNWRELGIALAQYLAMKKVPFTDSYLETQGLGKLAFSVRCCRFGLPVPRTIAARSRQLHKYAEKNELSYPLVLKADQAKKGRHNYLVKNTSELVKLLGHYDDTLMVLQEFIPNDGDYRVLVMNGKLALVILRMRDSEDTHLNNTSQGGSALLVAPEDFDKSAAKAALVVASYEQVEVAGVDIVFDKSNGRYYFLEVNQAPQIGTGAFVDEKVAAYAAMIDSFSGKERY